MKLTNLLNAATFFAVANAAKKDIAGTQDNLRGLTTDATAAKKNLNQLRFNLLQTDDYGCEPEPLETPAPTECQTPEPEQLETPAPTECPTPAPTECQTPEPEQLETPAPTECQTPAPTECQTPAPTECPTEPEPLPCSP